MRWVTNILIVQTELKLQLFSIEKEIGGSREINLKNTDAETT